MRNDARPIGEEFRDIADHHNPDRAPDGTREGQPVPPRDEHPPFVIDRDPGDEERPSDARIGDMTAAGS
jgi:hypothetical protein